MSLEKSLIETMRKRQSIRAFDTQDISDSDYKKILDYLNNEHNLIGPFGGSGRIELVQVTNNVSEKGIKLGTYGFIKSPKAYLVGLCENNQKSLLE